MKSAERLAEWVEQKHRGQVKKYSGEPYFNHVLEVAELAKPIITLGYEIGLCHDLLEDTNTSEHELYQALLGFNYNPDEARHVTDCVVELTDVFTAVAYPFLSRERRKGREAARLLTISTDAQTVKYCDLLTNIPLVMRYDKNRAPEYLRKKEILVRKLYKGNSDLREKTLALIYNCLEDLQAGN